ncbi:MAG: hypothetical protein AAGF11_29725 [Myxococcota bacterium]
MPDESKLDAPPCGPSIRVRSRLCLTVGSGLLLGGALSVATPSVGGCIYHDTCIKATSPGHDWCRNLTNALQWPAGGSIDDAIPVTYENGAVPQGCRCFNDAEDQILNDDTPECKLDELLDEIEAAVRQECQSLVLPGNEHNCWQANGPNASTLEGKFKRTDPGSCIGNCKYGGAPSGGSCPELNPYECATGDDGGLCGATEDSDTDSDEPDSADSTSDDSDSIDTSGGVHELDADLFIHCSETTCEIDSSFAHMLYDDPTLLLSESARLYFDSEEQRYILVSVEPGSVAYTLGLRTTDRLESINGTVIDSLAAGMRAYSENNNKDELDLRIMRGSQWLDFDYLLVP